VPSSMKLIVGLGNPGSEYAKTRHNAGFMVVDRLALRHRLPDAGPAKMKFHAGVLEGPIAGERCILMQPMTYMNRSGLAIGEAVAFYKLDPTRELLVVVDDVALDVGRIRLRAEGSAGGHNGLADVERALGTSAYPRLRIGIDPKGRVPQKDYVLGRFTPEQLAKLEPTLDVACDAIECWIKEGIARAMTRYNAQE
jgi:PTH1 family peptidyl-tRNA hydrolase